MTLLLLLGNLGYFHDDPYTISLNYYSVAQGSYFSGGGNFIKGGSQVLSDYLASQIEAGGGMVLLRHLVTKINVRADQATGVEYINLDNKKKETFSAFGSEIIANAALPRIAEKLLPEETGKRILKDISGFRPGASLLTVYFGFNKALKDIGNKHYSVFCYDPSVQSQKDILPNNRGSFDKRSFTFVDYSQLESGLAPEGKSVGAVCCIDYTSIWENFSREEYRAKKQQVQEIFISKLDDLIPGFRNAIEYVEVGTSKTVERYTLNPGGAVYGFAQTPERAGAEEIRILENLHIASAWSKFGGGFSGAIYSGYMTAMSILRKR